MLGGADLVVEAEEHGIGDGQVKRVVLERQLVGIHDFDFDVLRRVLGEGGTQLPYVVAALVCRVDLDILGNVGIHDLAGHGSIAAAVVMDDEAGLDRWDGFQDLTCDCLAHIPLQLFNKSSVELEGLLRGK